MHIRLARCSAKLETRSRLKSLLKSLWHEPARRELRSRLTRLTPDATPQWGQLTAPRAIAHLIDAARMALGDVAVRPRRGGLRLQLLHLAPVRSTFIYVLRFPKNVPSAHELFVTQPRRWADDLATLDELLERLAVRAAEHDPQWPPHPYFGHLSTRAWGVLGYRHTDHHLRQFGA